VSLPEEMGEQPLLKRADARAFKEMLAALYKQYSASLQEVGSLRSG
jgi:LAS superfamily LD-carboxypeptidase LdcB